MNQERLLSIILSPHISEKSTLVADNYRQIVFKVSTDAKKLEIKKAIEILFKVKVEKVRILKVKGKSKTFKQVSGRRANWKKAYVTLKEGYDINFAGAK